MPASITVGWRETYPWRYAAVDEAGVGAAGRGPRVAQPSRADGADRAALRLRGGMREMGGYPAGRRLGVPRERLPCPALYG
jgi:hypothetical protein